MNWEGRIKLGCGPGPCGQNPYNVGRARPLSEADRREMCPSAKPVSHVPLHCLLLVTEQRVAHYAHDAGSLTPCILVFIPRSLRALSRCDHADRARERETEVMAEFDGSPALENEHDFWKRLVPPPCGDRRWGDG